VTGTTTPPTTEGTTSSGDGGELIVPGHSATASQ